MIPLLAESESNKPQASNEKPNGAYLGCAVLLLLAILEILAFSVRGVFSIVAAYTWFALGVFSLLYLCLSYLEALVSDLRKGSLWGLLPLAAAIPLCFFYIDSFAFTNTESLSELHDTYQKLKNPDRGYTAIFWSSYPSRSLILNLIPTFFWGISPWSYRVGFGYPLLFGSLFLFAGIRRYHLHQAKASAVAGLISAGIFAYPMFCQITRTFEMAISSVSFGMWAAAASFIFAAQPTVITALVAAWSIGLLSASFTSGLALVALIWFLLGVWSFRAYLNHKRSQAALGLFTLANCIVFGVALYAIRPKTIRLKEIPFSEMLSNFVSALDYSFLFSGSVFIPSAMVIPTALALIFALSLRGGWLPLIISAWCLPVIWSATNLHGKIGPQLPFALYRALIIIPALLYVMGSLVLWIIAQFKDKQRWIATTLPLLLAVGLSSIIANTYQRAQILRAPRQAAGREVIAAKLLEAIEARGFSPFTEAWIADRTNDKRIDNFLPFMQYFLLNWQRIDKAQTLPSETAERKPGVIVVTQDDPLTTQLFPGYQPEIETSSIALSDTSTVSLAIIFLRPS